jgi:N-acylneuraminate cytidylyltransferase
MKIIAVIPARGGSKGIPEKNLSIIKNYTLIEWSIRIAQKTSEIDEVYVDTDNPKIYELAKSYGCIVPRLRPDHLSQDDTKIIDSLTNFLSIISSPKSSKNICVVLLQPTNPFRKSSEISNAIRLWYKYQGKKSIYTVCEPLQSPKDFIKFSKFKYWKPAFTRNFRITNRQDISKIWFISGSIYVFSHYFLLKKKAIVTRFSSKFIETDIISGVDIDTQLDLEIANALAKSFSLKC